MRNVVDTTHRRRWTATIVLVVVAQILLLSLIAILVDAFAVANNKHHNHHLPLHRHCHNNVFFRGQKHHFHTTPSTSTLLQPRSSSSSSLVVGMLIRPSSLLSSSQPYALTSIVDTCTRSSTSTSTTSTTSSRPLQCSKLSRRQPLPDRRRRLGRGLFSTAFDDQEQPNDATLKKKKESVIEKIERKYFSDQMESRFLRILLYPLKILIWKPLRMIMKFFINHSDKEEDKTMVLDVRDSSSSKSKSNTVNISTPPLKMIPLEEEEIEDNSSSSSSITTVNSDTATNNDTTTTTSSISISTDDISSSTSAPKVIISEEADDTSIAVVTSDNATNDDTTTTTSSIDISSSSSAPKLIISEETDDTTSIAAVTSDNSINDDTTTPSTSTSEVVGAEADIGAVVPTCPKGDRWAVSAPDVDLSGRWELIITPEFKKKYDTYLKRLGQPMLVRSVALSQPVLSQTNEKLTQTELGRSLLINGKNIRGTWDRTLITSGTSLLEDDYSPLQVPIMTVDSEQVEAESWWEDQGKVHMSYLRGVTMYGGGSFVSRRYFEEQISNNDDEVYVCESAFEFNDIKKEPNKLAWRFCRQK